MSSASAHTFTIEEANRQAIVLALARLSVSRPGWARYLQGIAASLEAEAMFEEFRVTAGPAPGFPGDTSNRFQVVRSDLGESATVVVLKLDPALGRHVFTIEEALQLATWLAVLADPEMREFPRMVEEIKQPKGTTT